MFTVSLLYYHAHAVPPPVRHRFDRVLDGNSNTTVDIECAEGRTVEAAGSSYVCRFTDGSGNWDCPAGWVQGAAPNWCTPTPASEGCTLGGAKQTVHTFWQQVKGMETSNTDQEMLELWNASWSLAGFHTRILTLADARRHPLYNQVQADLNQMASTGLLGTNVEYDRLCYLRYLAMAASGGGWMTDYDVLPLVMPKCSGLPNQG